MMKIEQMISTNRADCSGCEACANACPKNAITMTRDAEGFAYPKINSKLCVQCGRCDATCPALNFKKKFPAAFPKVFAAVNRNQKIRLQSSSGGVFTALSEIILRNGGIVFGAAFDENFHVAHTAARTPDELEKLRGSKYVQSKIGDVYRQVRDALKSRKVLFSGTPCQCAGLKNFLGKDHENLLTVEIICHGAPSPALWENYISELGYAHEVTHVNFRSKRNGWQNFCVEVNFSDQGYYCKPINSDIFGKIFLSNLTLRPSCHTCKFKFPSVQSDLTLGDAWGVQKFAPKMFDNRGTSVIFIHTAKGEEFLKQSNIVVQPVRFFDVVMSNTAFIVPLTADPRRKNFFAHIAQITDKFAVMQHYAYQDDRAIRKQIGEQNQRALMQSYQKIVANIRGQFTQNVLVMSTPRDQRRLKTLGDYIDRKLPNSNVYILQPSGNKQFICVENFSSLNFPVESDAVVMMNLIKKLHVEKIFIEQSIVDKSPNVTEWLKSCGVPAQTFTEKA